MTTSPVFFLQMACVLQNKTESLVLDTLPNTEIIRNTLASKMSKATISELLGKIDDLQLELKSKIQANIEDPMMAKDIYSGLQYEGTVYSVSIDEMILTRENLNKLYSIIEDMA